MREEVKVVTTTNLRGPGQSFSEGGKLRLYVKQVLEEADAFSFFQVVNNLSSFVRLIKGFSSQSTMWYNANKCQISFGFVHECNMHQTEKNMRVVSCSFWHSCPCHNACEIEPVTRRHDSGLNKNTLLHFINRI